MTFQFSNIEEGRRQHKALKYIRTPSWDPLPSDAIPMWIADTDLPSPPCVIEALRERLNHPTFGYTESNSSDLFDAFHDWANSRYIGSQFLNRDYCCVCPTIVTAISMAISAFTSENDSILISSPVYPPFRHLPAGLSRNIIHNILIPDKNEVFTMDFDDLEAKMKNASLYILCNPHNPGGVVWSSECLDKIAELAVKYNVFVLSDEIHADLILSDSKKHVTFAQAAVKAGLSRVMFCFSVAKTFNMAGFVTSIISFIDENMFSLFKNQLNKSGIHGVNCLGPLATTVAYRKGSEWLDQTIEILNENIDLCVSFFEKYPQYFTVYRPQASFLVWLDCRGLAEDGEKISQFFSSCKVVPSIPGAFGPNSECCVRLNIGTSKNTLTEALRRIEEQVQELSVSKH
ncbi:hypothetical protein RCL1_004227 [Eukaryota sp. TZLM3-RCL]